MSSRWYPIYNRGNPQLRIFLPNFWMKLVRDKDKKLPPYTVEFQVSPEMTKIDVKNYLEQIYKVPVLDVHTHIQSGKTFYSRHNGGYDSSRQLLKDEDIKYAIIKMVINYYILLKLPMIFITLCTLSLLGVTVFFVRVFLCRLNARQWFANF